jgi:hypothetical protein
MERPFSVVSVQRGYLEENRRYEAASERADFEVRIREDIV